MDSGISELLIEREKPQECQAVEEDVLALFETL